MYEERGSEGLHYLYDTYGNRAAIYYYDEDGDFWNIASGAIIGATISVVAQVIDNVVSGAKWSDI